MERLNNELSSWKEKLLSHARKEILIKTVAQVVPTYIMSIFKLPNTLCDEMTAMVRRFWWGQANVKNKMTWLSWDKMCLPKEEGGFGFLDLKGLQFSTIGQTRMVLTNMWKHFPLQSLQSSLLPA